MSDQRNDSRNDSHLPECYLSGSPSLCPMCEALRACEQRLLDAAREAVVSMVIDTVGNSAAEHLRNKAVVSQTLAAIAALRVKP